MDRLPPVHASTGEQTHSLGMCPGWEPASNLWVHRTTRPILFCKLEAQQWEMLAFVPYLFPPHFHTASVVACGLGHVTCIGQWEVGGRGNRSKAEMLEAIHCRAQGSSAWRRARPGRPSVWDCGEAEPRPIDIPHVARTRSECPPNPGTGVAPPGEHRRYGTRKLKCLGQSHRRVLPQPGLEHRLLPEKGPGAPPEPECVWHELRLNQYLFLGVNQ